MAQKLDTRIEEKCDDIFVELFKNDKEFLSWFNTNIAQRLETPIPINLGLVEKSHRRELNNGQTDIYMNFKDEDCELVLLIENKVMSPFTFNQPERYQLEAAELSKKNDRTAKCVLICPQKYARSSSQAKLFDAYVTYEEIIEVIKGQNILEAAVERCNTGWVAEEVLEVTDNFQFYSNLMNAEFPNLKMKTKETNKPTQSRTIEFDEKFMGLFGKEWPEISIKHQWQEGSAKVLFRDWGKYRDILEGVINKDLARTLYRIDPNKTKSLGFMIETPKIDNHLEPHNQAEEMLAGLQAIINLRDFMKENLEMVQNWRSIVGESCS